MSWGRRRRPDIVRLANVLLTLKIDYLFTVGGLAGEIARGARAAGMPASRVGIYPDNQAAVAVIRDFVKSGDVVLVKGSRAAHMEEIVAPLIEGG